MHKINLGIYIVIILVIILLFFNFINKIIKIENYVNIKTNENRPLPNTNLHELKKYNMITTWKPYIIDKYFQPGYSDYFYRNGYMYSIY
jgi:hypothetical protein